jgi:hypothetical protein
MYSSPVCGILCPVSPNDDAPWIGYAFAVVALVLALLIVAAGILTFSSAP